MPAQSPRIRCRPGAGPHVLPPARKLSPPTRNTYWRSHCAPLPDGLLLPRFLRSIGALPRMKMIFRIFLQGDRLRSVLVLLSLLAAAAVEAIGIGALLPAAGALLGEAGASTQSNQIAQGMIDWLGITPDFKTLVLLIAGAFMEPSAIILILAPILFPIAVQLGIDPIHLGIIMVVNMEIGMITSNEPGIYRPGKWGVRIENLLLCVPAQNTEFGEYLQFESLTLCPIDTRCIELDLMSQDLNLFCHQQRLRPYPLTQVLNVELLFCLTQELILKFLNLITQLQLRLCSHHYLPKLIEPP